MQDQKLNKKEISSGSNIKRYKISGKDLRKVFNVYEEIFAQDNAEYFQKFKRSSEKGMRAMLIKEEYEENPIFAIAMQTAKYSTTVFLSKTHKENYSQSLEFFKKIKNFFNPGEVFVNLNKHMEEKG